MHAMQSVTVETSDLVRLHTSHFEPADPASNTAIVLVHPYTILTGLQTVLWGIAGGLAERGYRAVTYERRGTGESTGDVSSDGDVEDVVTVCRWLSDCFDPHGIVLVGFSTVAPLAGTAAPAIARLLGFVSFGYPFGSRAPRYFGQFYDEAVILGLDIPRLFIMGTADELTTVEELRAKLEPAYGHVETLLLDGVEHFDLEGPAIDPPMADLIARFAESLTAGANPGGTSESADTAESTAAATADTASAESAAAAESVASSTP